VGGAGNTTLTGGPLDDTLDDGGVACTMTGGVGNDTYLVHNAGTVVVEKASAAFTAPTGWTIVGTADFNNDGQLDVVVTNGSANQIWYLNNGSVASTTSAYNFGSAWPLLGEVTVNGNHGLLYQQAGGSSQEVDFYANGSATRTSYLMTSGLSPDPIQ